MVCRALRTECGFVILKSFKNILAGALQFYGGCDCGLLHCVRDGSGKPAAKEGMCAGARTCSGQPGPEERGDTPKLHRDKIPGRVSKIPKARIRQTITVLLFSVVILEWVWGAGVTLP